MTQETLEKANKITCEMKELEKEIERLPRQYIHWNDETAGYWKRMFIRIKEKYYVKFPQRYEGDKDILMELTKEDLGCLVDLRKEKMNHLKKELEELKE